MYFMRLMELKSFSDKLERELDIENYFDGTKKVIDVTARTLDLDISSLTDSDRNNIRTKTIQMVAGMVEENLMPYDAEHIMKNTLSYVGTFLKIELGIDVSMVDQNGNPIADLKKN
jgi:hypothetical protein